MYNNENIGKIGNFIKEFIEGNYKIEYPKKYSVCESLKNKNNENKRYIYDEFSFQHELGSYLRERLGDEYIVKFEYNVNNFKKDDLKIDTCKKEIDIVIKKCTEKEIYAIELKYLKNEAYPYRMFQCVKDMRFMKDVSKIKDIIKEAYCVVITENRGFYEEKGKKEYFNEKILKCYEDKYIEDMNKSIKRMKNEIFKIEEEIKNQLENKKTEKIKTRKNILNKEIDYCEKQKEMAEAIKNKKNICEFPTIYKYFRDAEKTWKKGKYIYSNLTDKLDIIDISDFKDNVDLKWNPVDPNDEKDEDRYYILRFST